MLVVQVIYAIVLSTKQDMTQMTGSGEMWMTYVLDKSW